MKTIERPAGSSTSLAHQARKTIDATSSLLPQWLGKGAALTLATTGTKVIARLARRNPATAVAIGVIGAGVLGYRMYRRRADEISAAAEADPSSVEVPAVRKRTTKKAANQPESASIDT